jgi:SPP1 family predicted phage head-tail adaptor
MPSSTPSVGAKNHRITIQQATQSQDSRGASVLTWPGTTIATLWAEKRETAGGEGVVAEQLFATRTVTYTVWYRTDLAAGMRIVEGSRVFDIRAITDPDGRKWELELECVEMGV